MIAALTEGISRRAALLLVALLAALILAPLFAGDYLLNITAIGDGVDQNVSYRVTVLTSTLWGVAGIGVILIALLVLVGAVGRFGRR